MRCSFLISASPVGIDGRGDEGGYERSDERNASSGGSEEGGDRKRGRRARRGKDERIGVNPLVAGEGDDGRRRGRGRRRAASTRARATAAAGLRRARQRIGEDERDGEDGGRGGDPHLYL